MSSYRIADLKNTRNEITTMDQQIICEYQVDRAMNE